MKEKLNVLGIVDRPAERDKLSDAFVQLQLEPSLSFTSDLQTTLHFLEALRSSLIHARNLPGLIILDLQLKDHSAMMLLKELKNHEVYQQIPVVVFSENHSVAERNLCFESGGNGYFHKTDSFEKFLSTLKLVVDFWFREAAVSYVPASRNRPK